MNLRRPSMVVLESLLDVDLLLDDVQTAADANRNSLGFFPAAVYREFARRGQLYVAVDTSTGARPQYAGHLLFDCRFPRAHILQMYVDPQFRNAGVASLLLSQLRDSLTSTGFISIYARVAEDLEEANIFWAKQDFYVQRVEPGGQSRKRTILVRARELASPQLFEVSGLSQFNPLGLPAARSTEPLLFLLDLNVVFDIGPRRPRHEEVAALYQAERMNFCRLAVSSEAREELMRTASPGRTDPMQSFVALFPTFPQAKGPFLEQLSDELSAIVFPGKDKSQLTANDKSDLSHIATGIQHNLGGVVTNDGALLQSAPAIQARFGIRIVSSAAFSHGQHALNDGTFVQTGETATLNSRRLETNDDPHVHKLLRTLGLTGSAIAAQWIASEAAGRASHRIGVWREDLLIGYLTWPAWTPNGAVVARIAIDENNGEARDAARALLMHLLTAVTEGGPQEILLEFPQHQTYVREIAFGLGFSGSPQSSALQKLVDGHVWTPANWAKRQHALASKGRLRLPAEPPRYRNSAQQIEVHTPDGNRAHLSFGLLESLLAPTLLCLEDRPAVITPIRRAFAEPLLGHSTQSTLLPDLSASLFAQRHFVSSSRSLKHFSRGTLILFYESGKENGRAAIVAIAKVQSAYLREVSSISEIEYKQSVLNEANVHSIGRAQLKTVTVFDSIFALPRQVPLQTLGRLGCGKPNDLITTKPISGHQLQDILKEAFPQ